MRKLTEFARHALALGAFVLSACATNSAPSGPPAVPLGFGSRGLVSPAFQKPALVTLDLQGGELEYWPIKPTGGSNPIPISPSLGTYSGYGLVASGDLVAIANYSPAEVVTYNLRTKAMHTLPDPYGNPVDIAIDKKKTLYVLNRGNVAVYPGGASQPSELTCQSVDEGVAIAVDNESDVFINGYGPSFLGIAEFAAGSQTCKVLHLRAEQGYVGGVGVDPKTDSLIVVDNPDLCAGGIEGRMFIYPKPYERRTSLRRNLNATYCAGTFRLDATSTTIFVSDSTVSAGFPLIDQRTYPGARGGDVYQSEGSNYSFGGFTTIPNALPN